MNFLVGFFLVIFLSFQAQAQGLCQHIFADPPVKNINLTNFQETLALLYLLTGEKMTPPVLERMALLESWTKKDSPLLEKLNLETYTDATGKVTLRWKAADLSNPQEASKALVKLSRLIALENYKDVRTNKDFLGKIKDYKSDVINRIDTEVYLKALLQSESYFKISSQLSLFLPRSWMKVHDVRLEKKFVDILNNQGLEAFHQAVAARYGWNVAAHLVRKTTWTMTRVAGAISAAVLIYYYQQGDDYFTKMLALESGLDGEDHKLFNEIVQKSGLKTTKEIVQWLGKQNYDDPEMREFVQELQTELETKK